VHPHGQVLPLGVAGRDVRRVRLAGDRRLARPDALPRTVAPLRRTRRTLGWRGAVELHQHRIVDVVAEGVLDRLQVGAVAVAGELHPVRQPGAQIVHERRGVLTVAPADEP
jgi:hypothetical protein